MVRIIQMGRSKKVYLHPLVGSCMVRVKAHCFRVCDAVLITVEVQLAIQPNTLLASTRIRLFMVEISLKPMATNCLNQS